MEKSFIKCPSCGKEIELTDALKEQVRAELSGEIEKQYKLRETTLRGKEYELIQKQVNLDALITEKLKEATEKAEKEALAKATSEVQGELTRLQASEDLLKKSLTESKIREKELLTKEATLQEKIEDVELEVARQVSTKTTEIRDAAEQKFNLKDQENKLLIGSLNKQIEELDKKVKQGSQQRQGEVLEEELESLLRSKFPLDTISEVKKGVRGADVLQIVNNNLGEPIGSILYESKNTKDFKPTWIPKLKGDMIDAKADIGVLLSVILPESINHIGEMDGAWITDYSSVLGLASALRSQLLAVALQKRNERGKADKAVILYDYLTGSEFKQRINLIVEPFVQMQTGIAQEKRAMSKIWNTREKQISHILDNLGAFAGDVIGITGKNLELPAFSLGSELSESTEDIRTEE